MNKERLLKLADLMDTKPASEMYLGGWKQEFSDHKCAIGHACDDPWFNSQGLKWNKDELKGFFPVFGSLIEVDAVYAFFDINQEDFESFGFANFEYTRPEGIIVANKIRELIKNHAD